MVNHPWEYRNDAPLHSTYIILQTRTFNHKIVSIGVISFLLIYFLRTPLHGLAFYSLNYPLYLFPHNSTMCLYISIKLMLLFILCILYYCSLEIIWCLKYFVDSTEPQKILTWEFLSHKLICETNFSFLREVMTLYRNVLQT